MDERAFWHILLKGRAKDIAILTYLLTYLLAVLALTIGNFLSGSQEFSKLSGRPSRRPVKQM